MHKIFHCILYIFQAQKSMFFAHYQPFYKMAKNKKRHPDGCLFVGWGWRICPPAGGAVVRENLPPAAFLTRTLQILPLCLKQQKRHPDGCLFCWLGMKDLNPHKQSQSLSCCHYTNPQYFLLLSATVIIITKTFWIVKYIFTFF